MERPLLSLCMIVRNEEDNLARCLESVRGVADEIIVVDTGSTDRTVEIAHAHGARVFRFDWTGDFAAARNFSLEQARGEWIMYLDADEELVAEDTPRVRPLLARPGVDGYLMRCVNFLGEDPDAAAVVHPQFRLFRNRPEYRFQGEIHEQILSVVTAAGGRVEVAPVRIYHYGYQRRACHANEKPRRNIEIIEERLRRDPDDSFMRFSLGMEYMRLGEFERALAEYQRSFAGRGKDDGYAPMLVRNICVCLFQLRRYDDLVRVADEALQVYPDYTDLVYLKGLARFEQQRYSEAAEAFRRCLEMGDAGHPYMAEVGLGGLRAWLALGQVYERLGDEHNAVRAYTRALREDHRSALPIHYLGTLLLQREQPEAVAAFFDRHADQTSGRVLEALARVFAAARCYRQALPYLDRALEVVGPSGLLLLLRAECLAMLRRPAEARQALAGIGRGSEHHGPARLLEAFCHLLEDRPEEAARALDALATDEAWRPEVEAYRALAALWQDRSPAAPALDEEGWARFEGAVWTLLSRLLQLQEFERFEQALGVVALVPRPEADKKLALGKLYYHLGFKDSAFEEMAAALEAGVYDRDSLAALAGLCVERGLLEDAELLYWRCLGMDRRRLATYTGLVRVLAEQGKLVEARQVVLMGKREFPGSEVLEALQASLRLAAG